MFQDWSDEGSAPTSMGSDVSTWCRKNVNPGPAENEVSKQSTPLDKGSTSSDEEDSIGSNFSLWWQKNVDPGPLSIGRRGVLEWLHDSVDPWLHESMKSKNSRW